jgi:hypothetical protein
MNTQDVIVMATFWLKDSSQKEATCYHIQLQHELKYALLVIKVNNIE